MPGFHEPAGTGMVAAWSAVVIIYPQVNSTVLRAEHMHSR
jgi:hypothetical protein